MTESDELNLDIAAVKAGGGKKKKIIIFAVIGFLLINIIGAGAFFLLTKKESGADGGPVAEEKSPESSESAIKKDHVFIPLEPSFLVNFDTDSRPKFLQVSVTLMANTATAKDHINKIMPILRNNVLMILSGRNPADLKSREGKEVLRVAVLGEIQKLMLTHFQEKSIDDVLFTEFVMQ